MVCIWSWEVQSSIIGGCLLSVAIHHHKEDDRFFLWASPWGRSLSQVLTQSNTACHPGGNLCYTYGLDDVGAFLSLSGRPISTTSSEAGQAPLESTAGLEHILQNMPNTVLSIIERCTIRVPEKRLTHYAFKLQYPHLPYYTLLAMVAKKYAPMMSSNGP